MNYSHMTRTYALGLGYGSLWLVSACIGFGILDMVNINTNSLALLLSILGILVIGGALLFLCIKLLRFGYTLPKTGRGTPSRARRRIFLLLILLEIVGWITLNTLLGQNGHAIWIVPIDLALIGAHFIPLASVFHVLAYLVMGILWLVVIAGSMLLFPSTMIIGHTSAWTTIPSIGCVVVTWLTAFYLLMKVNKNVQATAQVTS